MRYKIYRKNHPSINLFKTVSDAKLWLEGQFLEEGFEFEIEGLAYYAAGDFLTVAEAIITPKYTDEENIVNGQLHTLQQALVVAKEITDTPLIHILTGAITGLKARLEVLNDRDNRPYIDIHQYIDTGE